MTTNCKYCGKEISPKTKMCPHCEEPNPLSYADFSSYFKSEQENK